MVERINTIIEAFLKKTKKQLQEREKIKKTITAALDKKTSKHIKQIKTHKRILTLYTDSSSSSYQLNLYRNNILKEIKKILPDIENIKIKIG